MKNNLSWGNFTLKIHVPFTDFLSDSKYLAQSKMCTQVPGCAWNGSLELFNRIECQGIKYWWMSGKHLPFLPFQRAALCWRPCATSLPTHCYFSLFFLFHPPEKNHTIFCHLSKGHWPSFYHKVWSWMELIKTSSLPGPMHSVTEKAT